jgi:hypothetical protein
MSEPVRGNWWSRNWKWFVPAGCLSLIVLFAAFVGSILLVATTAMKSSDAYKEAVAKAQANPEVVEALGTPITTGFFTSGSVNTSGSSGDAKLSIPLSGPKGKATIQVEAKKSAGEWAYSKLVVEVENPQKQIDLLAHGGGAPE